tara:strand:- start:659 stop:1018 length:360 start_codon:yes stop_codon:yes gene_type:complete
MKLKVKNNTKNYILGYIWLCPWTVKHKDSIPYHFICYIDSRISGLNIAKYMIQSYEVNQENGERIKLLPYEVAISSKEYWKKYFKNEYNINNKTELKNMINNFNLRYSDLKWSELMSLY